MFEYPNEGINIPVKKFIESLGDLSGLKVLDCPAGDGRASFLLKNQGATVFPTDLYPEFYKATEDKCQYVDLSEKLPFEDEYFDFIICQEGIEHMQDQLGVFEEFNRVLKSGGTLFLTTPSMSHLRAKLSHFFVESDYWKRQAPSELDSIWFTNKDDGRMYFGHIFLLNIQKLRTLSVLSGFKVQKLLNSEIGSTSLLLFPFLYPFLLLVNGLSYLHSAIKSKYFKQPLKLAAAKEILALSCRPQTSFCKDLIVVLKKERGLAENIEYLKGF